MSALVSLNIHNPVHLAEAAANFIYEIKLRVYAVKHVLDAHESDFKEYKNDCIAYQLDDIYESLNRQLVVFNDATDEALSNNAARKAQEQELLSNYRLADEVDQDFILVSAYFETRKGWTDAMRGHLAALAELCQAETEQPTMMDQAAELLPKDSGERVLADKAKATKPAKSSISPTD